MQAGQSVFRDLPRMSVTRGAPAEWSAAELCECPMAVLVEWSATAPTAEPCK
jgi:hypothetical protein